MKKLMIFGAAICVAMAFTGCKSSESAYKKAYEKAKAQERTGYTTEETATGSSDVPVVAPVEISTPDSKRIFPSVFLNFLIEYFYILHSVRF